MSVAPFPTTVAAGEVLCWHCAEIADKIVRIPVNENGKKLLYGYFCSFPCAKRYCIDGGGCRRHELSRSLLALTATAGCADIKTAPPRIALKKFGGPLTVGEFRTGSSSGRQVAQVVRGDHIPAGMALLKTDVSTDGRQRQDGLFHEFVRRHRFQLRNKSVNSETKEKTIKKSKKTKGTLRGFFSKPSTKK